MTPDDRSFFDGTDQTHDFRSPIGANNQDLELQIALFAEMLELQCPSVKYHRLNRELTKVDELYNEASKPIFDGLPDENGKIVGVAVEIPIQFHFDVQKKLLQRYGIESEHKALAVMSCRLMEQHGIQPMTGDLIELLGVRYEILTVKFTDYFLQTQVPIALVATIEQVQQT